MVAIYRKLAIFTMPGGSEMECTDWAEDRADYARISEYVDVEFPRLDVSEIVDNKLKSLDHIEQVLREKFQTELNRIVEERAKILSLPNYTDPS